MQRLDHSPAAFINSGKISSNSNFGGALAAAISFSIWLFSDRAVSNSAFQKSDDLDPQTKKDVFEVYRFKMIPEQDQKPEPGAPKMLADGSEVIDAEPADDQEAGK